MVSRYEFVEEIDGDAYMDPYPFGPWVKYEDYQKLEEENKKLREDVKQLVRELHMF